MAAEAPGQERNLPAFCLPRLAQRVFWSKELWLGPHARRPRARKKNERIPLAKSAQAVARPAKREVRVAARGTARNQAARRSTLIAAAVATCWRCVLASPR